ncbi:LmeA family phospholipid-binding protein [Nocardia sp. CDC160]|uniref:LmeA family phospholipid-binding protein n=1 Tax=Nocardia sp. CDC160 TaxID=3112166 RepID=UPI002DB771B4|nr:DUF2993 domain-containing protein [Nocardia sp. CDC160]MEC3919633.1 DUF2993 domain-containing protein [Nocardia sp. CDC160]
MSSDPTSNDATPRDTAAQPADATVQPADQKVRPVDPQGRPVDLDKPDSAPTEVLGTQHDSQTEVLNGQGAAPTPRQEWWNDPTAQHGDQPTAVLGEQATQAIHPGEAAYAPGASGGHPIADQAGYPPNATAPLPNGMGYTGDPAYAQGATGGFQQPPGTPPPPVNVGGGQGGSPGMRRNRKKTLLIVGLVVALLVAGGLAGGEAYARHKYESCISSQFEAQMGSKIDVSFGWKPLLLTMFDKKVSSVTVDSDDTKFGPAQDMVVHATFNDVELKDNGQQGATVGSSTAEVTWSNAGITKTLGGLVSGATSDPNSGTLSFAVLGGLAQLQVKPKIVGDKIQVDTLQASLMGFGLPTDLVSGIVDLMTQSLQSYPMGLKPTKVEVTNDGLHVSLRGGHADLQAADQNGQQQNVTC